jgi:hypothetical protein
MPSWSSNVLRHRRGNHLAQQRAQSVSVRALRGVVRPLLPAGPGGRFSPGGLWDPKGRAGPVGRIGLSAVVASDLDSGPKLLGYVFGGAAENWSDA